MVTAGWGEVPGCLDTPWSQAGWGWGDGTFWVGGDSEASTTGVEELAQREGAAQEDGAQQREPPMSSGWERAGDPRKSLAGGRQGSVGRAQRESRSHERVRGGEDKGVHWAR